jgi:DNA-binding SARP family transcriptional activator
MPGRLDIAILGPLEVRRDGIPLKLGGASARMLLAVLALRVGEVVSPESLIDLLWGDSAPRAARATIQVYVSRFRKLLRSEAAELALIESRSGGYVLRIDREQIDAHRFDRSVHEGSVALGHGNADAALEKLERALALWRGEPLADLDVPSALRGELNALEELRLRAMETQFEAALATGRHLDFLSSMGTAVKEHPLNERLHALHMVALYRAGRQGEALDVASRMRRTLSQELGIQPSPALATLERQILEQDPSLDPVIPKRPSAVREARKTVVAMTVRVTAAALTGSTLDPEVVHPMTARVAARLNEIVRRHGGLVYETLPTSITVVFGLPSVHEDDAARAVRTAVELRAQLPGATPDGGHIGVRFEVRIALAAGEVLVQRVDEEERLLSSAPIEISAQLSSSAKPSEILLSETA